MPNRTDHDFVANYLENTIEITKKVRLPKGDFCGCCDFKKHRDINYIIDDCNCAIGGGVCCSLYGERLKLKYNFNNHIYAIIPPKDWTYLKCDSCLKDTEDSAENNTEKCSTN